MQVINVMRKIKPIETAMNFSIPDKFNLKLNAGLYFPHLNQSAIENKSNIPHEIRIPVVVIKLNALKSSVEITINAERLNKV